MKDVQSLNHTRWDCKYHVVFIPKRRKKAFMGQYASISAAFFMSWPGRRGPRLWRDVCGRTIYTCA